MLATCDLEINDIKVRLTWSKGKVIAVADFGRADALPCGQIITYKAIGFEFFRIRVQLWVVVYRPVLR